ncbi:hypothetical protein K505DRAFT_320257 [Melanomma pulvis-pyrius CBS 109.77]|uniref:Ribosomal RNA-processing protein 43 n=1 Tax=Melanomma pulvis-pyrius CBS 109.77 TaxID=1314802 RepID=A0A6A6XYA2_9PLEO|nr:hypothetical protein K505DRAFT_320257 [Melanomma pulvis-pyrius CBS 109.77]
MATALPPPPALSFPRPIFAALSPHPFLQAHLLSSTKSPLRANGRQPSDFRSLGVNPGSLTHCHGSAVVRSGNTSVVCGVRAEILREEDVAGTGSYGTKSTSEQDNDDNMDDEADDDEDDAEEIADLRLLVPNLELSTGSTPLNLPGTAPSAAAQTLITRLHALLLATRLVRAADLRIAHTPRVNAEDPDTTPLRTVKGYWVLYIDVFFISLDGNAFDAAWLAMLAALGGTRLPRAFWDEELEMVLCDDDVALARGLRLRGLPVPSTFAVFEGRAEDEDVGDGARNWVLSDPDAFEEAVCRETVTVVVDRGGVVRKIEKSGGGVVGREGMRDCVERSIGRWGVWEEVLRKA